LGSDEVITKQTFIISLSGGTGSFASACIAHEWGLDYRLLFADTLIEDEDLYRLLDDIGLDEQERLERAQWQWDYTPLASLLMMAGWSRQDAEHCYKRYEIKRPRLYDLGFLHNNCGGFCVRAGAGAFAHLLKHFPERYAEHEEQERRALREIKGGKPMMKYVYGGVVHGLTMEQLRKEKQPEKPDPRDWGTCGCFTGI
jgi:hypothetical protein